ncbi:BZ3500_MvSof-1268-A1-R1_Chr7-1g09286 [Microbotryum saponariae]|uniref:BZ3500_MvSof-1268-A1-R1_Chr7-1g09286 protein n=1 Tax=Microbotryum saponariae TaxID=289078 RepID=A0A2X0KX70_9BASI|nr:BZ3501_MvSof-1269-A2-R1_Chr7-1g08991 [Microbotryum saponariae]SDA03160.1 BZ3500_MvSof-1268-A1-R1_Chr7-1g09286 [Microbotryum saponariae]
MAEPYHLFVGGYGGCIYTLEFTPPSQGRNATLTETRPPSGGEGSTIVKSAGAAPTWLTLSSDRAYLYATDEWNEPEGQLTAYKVDPKTLALKKLSTVSSQGMWPCHSSLLEHTHPRKFVSTNYKGRSIVVHQVKENGDFDTEVEAVVHSLAERGTPGPHSWRQTQQHPHEAHVDPTGKVLVVSDLGTDDLRVYLISPSGTLTHHVNVALTPSSGPRHVAFSPPTVSHSTLYVSNELSNSVSVFRVTYANDEASTPSFKLLQDSISTLPDAPKGTQSPFERWHASEIKVHPSGKWLYIANRAEDHDPLNGTKEGENDSVAIFPIDIETGKIDPRGIKLIDCGGRGPRHFAFSAESKRERKAGNGEEDLWVAIAVHDSDEVVLSKVKEEDGTWEEVARLDGLGRPGIALWV